MLRRRPSVRRRESIAPPKISIRRFATSRSRRVSSFGHFSYEKRPADTRDASQRRMLCENVVVAELQKACEPDQRNVLPHSSAKTHSVSLISLELLLSLLILMRAFWSCREILMETSIFRQRKSCKGRRARGTWIRRLQSALMISCPPCTTSLFRGLISKKDTSITSGVRKTDVAQRERRDERTRYRRRSRLVVTTCCTEKRENEVKRAGE